MKTTPYSKLIRGAAFAYNFCADKLDNTQDATEKLYWSRQCAEHQDTLHRLVMAQVIHGNETVSVR